MGSISKSQGKRVLSMRVLGWFLFGLFLVVVGASNATAGTKLGSYEEAPYRDVVHMFESDFPGQMWVEIPEEYVFRPDLLRRIVSIDGHEFEDVILVGRLTDRSFNTFDYRYYLFDLLEEEANPEAPFHDQFLGLGDKVKWDPSVAEQEKERARRETYDFLKSVFVSSHISLWSYPEPEHIVSINGVPWQESPFRDQIIEQGKAGLKPSDKIMADKRYWEVCMNPAYNGRGIEVIRAMEFGIAPPGLGEIPPEGRYVVLTMGKNTVITFSDGRVNVLDLDTPLTSYDGVTMVPLRGVLEFLGASILYDPAKNNITIEDGATTVELVLGSKQAYVNGQAVYLAQPAIVKDKRTLVPLRFVAQHLGCEVLWDGDKQQATVGK